MPVLAPPRPKPAPPRDLRDDAVDGALAFALALVAGGDPYAFPLDFDVDLPPVLGGTAQEQAQLRAAAPLYLAAELESTRLVPAVETLAGLFASAALPGDPGPAAPLLRAFRRKARDRLTAEERDALFGRLFGKPYGPAPASSGIGRNAEFEPLMLDACELLAQFEPAPPHGPGVGGEVRLHGLCSALAANLSLRAGGITEYAARDTLEQVKDALEILKVNEVQKMFGARSAWMAVREIARRYLDQETDIVSRVARGRAGTAILAWLAEALPFVGDTTRRLLEPGSPVPGAAVAWMQATLALHETSAAAAAQAGRIAA